jgi:hypothetical protein
VDALGRLVVRPGDFRQRLLVQRCCDSCDRAVVVEARNLQLQAARFGIGVQRVTGILRLETASHLVRLGEERSIFLRARVLLDLLHRPAPARQQVIARTQIRTRRKQPARRALDPEKRLRRALRQARGDLLQIPVQGVVRRRPGGLQRHDQQGSRRHDADAPHGTASHVASNVHLEGSG